MFLEEELRSEYNKKYPRYLKLGNVLQQEINEILSEKEIPFDYVQMRVKSFDSFLEKISRNANWKSPMDENNDFCGLRIIHLFEDDLKLITKELNGRFHKAGEKNPTADRPKSEKEFTYRSYHMFLGLKDELLDENSDLAGMNAEVQIRTICMHSWAAIEHKLNYKTQFPQSHRIKFNRKFSQVSAVLEMADEVFVSLKNDREQIVNNYKSTFNYEDKPNLANLNVDSLQAYLETQFSTIQRDGDRIANLLKEMLASKVTLTHLEAGFKLLHKKGMIHRLQSNYPGDNMSQPGFARLVLDVSNDNFYS